MSAAIRAHAVAAIVFGLLPIWACGDAPSGGSAGQGAITQEAGGLEAESSVDAAASDDAPRDGASDSTGDDLLAVEAAPEPTCGPAPARYTLLTGASAGLVRDNMTGLVWMADSVGGGEPPQTQTAAGAYCAGRGMRMPTKDEALALAAGYASCAFGQWSTWTSTAASSGDAWVIDYLGDVSPQLAGNFPSAVLCVKDGAGD